MENDVQTSKRSIRFSRRVSNHLRRWFKEPKRKHRIGDRLVSFNGIHPKTKMEVRTRMDPFTLLCNINARLVAEDTIVFMGRVRLKTNPWKVRLELRGDIIVLRCKNDLDFGTDLCEDLSADSEAVVGVRGCTVQHVGKKVRLLRDGMIVSMIFQTETEAKAWKTELETTARRRIRTLADLQVVSPIGRGAGGKVFLVRDKQTQKFYALKAIEKRTVVFHSEAAFRHLVDERILLERVKGMKGFCQLEDAFQTESHFFYLTDFCEGGDVFNVMFHRQSGLGPSEAKVVAAQVVLCMERMHHLGFLYRDLKPENVLLDENGHVMLTDFGLCKYFPEGVPEAKTVSVCGSPEYIAPEVALNVGNGYGTSVDVYTFGVFLFHILVGYPPFTVDHVKSLHSNVKERSIPDLNNCGLSAEAADLVGQLIQSSTDYANDIKRMCLDEIKAAAFFKDVDWEAVEDRRISGLHSLVDGEKFFDEDARLLRNFDVADMRQISFVAHDVDEEYGERRLWPICFTKTLSLDDGFLPGFLYMP